MYSTDSRCVKGKPVVYVWVGEPIKPGPGESVQRAVARWFAQKLASCELAEGVLDFRHFDKHKWRLEGFIEERLNRAAAGKLTPGSEVVPIARAAEHGLPMFEFRWHYDARLLNTRKKELIRHYDGEPRDEPGTVFGVHMHAKVLYKDDERIVDEQNEEMDRAITIFLSYTGS